MESKEKEEGLKLITKADHTQHTNILHSFVDGIIKRGRPMYQDYSETWTLQEWWDLIDAYESVIKTAVGNSWNKEEIHSQLEMIPESCRLSFFDVITTRKDEIRQQLAANTNTISQAVLEDFDWDVKLVMSSDRIASVQEPLLTLDLDVASQNNKTLHKLELDKDDLRKLIDSLDGANKVIHQWKT